MSGKKNMLDSLVGLSDPEGSSSGSDAEDSNAGAGAGVEAPAAKKAKKTAIDLETLRRHGLQEGPSVLFVPEKREEGGSWAWGSGADRGLAEEETRQEREANREAVTRGAEEAAALAARAQAQAAMLRAAQREEQERLKKAKNFTWNQKEKRKREEGKTTRGRNYVEEEKRRLREVGVFSGFD